MDPLYLLFGPKDRGGRSRKRPLPVPPLNFDRVMDGSRPRAFSSALFKLPIEILALIISFVESSSLAMLALVNRECRQLARSRQFASLNLDDSPSSMALVRLFISETRERSINNGLTALPSLGACVRRITVLSARSDSKRLASALAANSDNGKCSDSHEASHGEHSHGDEGKDGGKCRHGVEDFLEGEYDVATYLHYKSVYLAQLQIMLLNGKALPNLEYLGREDNVKLLPSSASKLARSPIQHLKVSGWQGGCEGCETEMPLPQAFAPKVWSLRTFYLDASLGSDCDPKAKVSARDWTSFLRLCAQTLETLVWISPDPLSKGEQQTFRDWPLPEFPHLRNLYLCIELIDDSSMDTFLNSKLVNLSIQNRNDFIDGSLANCGSIPSLNSFSYKHPIRKALISFLGANSQLSKLDLKSDISSTEVLENEVLPLLSKFTNLTSLRLRWPGNCSSVPETALRLIGGLHSLEQLGIRCGAPDMYGYGHQNWAVDHEMMRRHLSPLKKLRKLALLGDSYEPSIVSSGLKDYYNDTYATRNQFGYVGWAPIDIPIYVHLAMEDPKQGKPWWEKRHRNMLTIETRKYVSIFPDLEWMFFGEREIRLGVDDEEDDYNDDDDGQVDESESDNGDEMSPEDFDSLERLFDRQILRQLDDREPDGEDDGEDERGEDGSSFRIREIERHHIFLDKMFGTVWGKAREERKEEEVRLIYD